MPDGQTSPRTTLRTVRQWVAGGKRFAMLTCYDATTARWLWRGGVRCILVGDTAAQMILGHDSTLPAGLQFMLEITAAVRRGAPGAFIMADMPFGSYQCGDDEAVRNAMAFMTVGGADAVKLEVDASFAGLVGRLSSAGVPVVAHLGSRPQQVRAQGQYRQRFRSAADVEQLVLTAVAMVQRGAVMLLLEAVPNELSQRIVEAVNRLHDEPVPVVGCGGGPACHGHVIVLHDLLGLTDWHPPFARPVADLGARIQQAAEQWVGLVASGEYLKADHPYTMEGQ